MGRPAAKQRVREARTAMYRALIIESAERVFADAGFEATRVQDVAAECGISLATLYGVFRGKNELYSAIHKERLVELMGRISHELDPDVDPLDSIIERDRIYVEFHMEHVDYLRMHLREGNAWAAGASLRVPEQAQAWARGLELGTAAFAACIEAGLMIEDDPALLFRTSVAMNQVRLAAWIDGGQRESSDEVTQRMRRAFVRAFCPAHIVAERLA